jgi:hypothetical protein
MSLLNEASFLVTPNSYKEDKLYAAIPTNGDGDMTFTRATTATRVDENDLVSSVASNVPRIDYTGGGCPSILLEPERINLLTYSEQFDNDEAWITSRTTIDATKVTAPDGSVTAQRLVPTVVSSTHYIGQTATFVSDTAYTMSIYAKADGYRYLRVGFPAAAFADSGRAASFDLQTGGAGAVHDGITTSIVNAGNGWFRCSITATADASAGGTAAFNSQSVDNASSETFTGDGKSGAQLWGAQLEAGAYPTSYIPTTIESLTRIADGINRDDIYTNNLITEEGGTWFVHLINNVVMLRDTSNVGLFIGNSSNGVTGDVLAIRNNGNNRLTINKRIAGSQTQIYLTTTDHVKVAIKWNGTTADVFVNGIKVVSATSFTATDMEFFSGTGADVSKYIKQMALFPTPLDDDECKALTTL